MFYVLGDGCLDAVVKKGDVDLRCKIFSGQMEKSPFELKFTMITNIPPIRVEHMLEDSTLEVRSFVLLETLISDFSRLRVGAFI